MNEKFLDPKTNPMIKIQPFEDSLPLPDDEEPGPDLEDFRVPLGGYLIPEKKTAASEEKPKVEPGDFELKVKTFMEKIDEWAVASPIEQVDLFRISKRSCGTLQVIRPDGAASGLEGLNDEERKIVLNTLGRKCSSGEDRKCPCM